MMKTKTNRYFNVTWIFLLWIFLSDKWFPSTKQQNQFKLDCKRTPFSYSGAFFQTTPKVFIHSEIRSVRSTVCILPKEVDWLNFLKSRVYFETPDSSDSSPVCTFYNYIPRVTHFGGFVKKSAKIFFFFVSSTPQF